MIFALAILSGFMIGPIFCRGLALVILSGLMIGPIFYSGLALLFRFCSPAVGFIWRCRLG